MTYLCCFPTHSPNDWKPIQGVSPSDAAISMFITWSHLLGAQAELGKARVDVRVDGVPEEEAIRFLVFAETKTEWRVVAA